jgi:hypothetical protein
LTDGQDQLAARVQASIDWMRSEIEAARDLERKQSTPAERRE